jgi:uncharacterized protein (TIGR03382 family)
MEKQTGGLALTLQLPASLRCHCVEVALLLRGWCRVTGAVACPLASMGGHLYWPETARPWPCASRNLDHRRQRRGWRAGGGAASAGSSLTVTRDVGAGPRRGGARWHARGDRLRRRRRFGCSSTGVASFNVLILLLLGAGGRDRRRLVAGGERPRRTIGAGVVVLAVAGASRRRRSALVATWRRPAYYPTPTACVGEIRRRWR